MEYHGRPVRVVIPYDWFAEFALTRVQLMRLGVPWRVLDDQLTVRHWLAHYE